MRICTVNNVHIAPVCFTFEGACKQGKTFFFSLSEKQAGKHKPCHIDLITVPLTQMAFIWKQTRLCSTDVQMSLTKDFTHFTQA